VNNKIIIGVVIGVIAGILDVIPMLIQKLTWDANLSAFFLWVVVGFIIATSNLKLPAIIKGIVIGFVCLLPSVFIVGWNNPLNLIPIFIMTLILGGLVGFAFHKLVKD
jgi:hypothetical protein